MPKHAFLSSPSLGDAGLLLSGVPGNKLWLALRCSALAFVPPVTLEKSERTPLLKPAAALETGGPAEDREDRREGLTR
jgi:hypothetical protein